MECPLHPDEIMKPPRSRFIPLPARPMIDIRLNECLKRDDVESFLRAKALEVDRDAVVRLKPDRGLDPSVRSVLTTRFLRDVFPDTVNVQFSGPFHQGRKS